jgi:4-amino-4-deoxy-L-arabinose transferase-like glycosyltransferase
MTSTPAQRGLFWVLATGLALLFCALVLNRLGLAFERDYDEGVYWQSLRTMSAGHRLYGQIFYSQPPLFLLSLFPVYLGFGQSLFAARLGVLLLSLFGLLGVALVGHAIRGRIGLIVALALLAINPFFIAASQTLQADAPSAALMVLALGLAFQWWRRPTGVLGYTLAVLTGLALVAAVGVKLLGLAASIPIFFLALGHLWRSRLKPAGGRFGYCGSLLAGLAAVVLGAVLVLVPFRSSISQLWDQVVSFHVTAKALVQHPLIPNFKTLAHFFLETPLVLLAAIGTIISLVRRDWLVLPLLAWALALFGLCLQQAPLFHHHLVTFIPPLVPLSVRAIDPIVERGASSGRIPTGVPYLLLAAVFAGVLGLSLFKDLANYRHVDRLSAADAQLIHDLDSVTRPEDLVITDAQTVLGLAERSTPPELVDTSFVRIGSGYLKLADLLAGIADGRVRAIVLTNGRLSTIPAFRDSLGSSFHRVFDYENGREIWVRN